MKIDLIIPSHRNERGLRRLLQSLIKTDLAALQSVIVVFNPPDPKLAIQLRDEFAPAFTLKTLHLDQTGVNRARNAGIQASSAPLLFFADDDEEFTNPDLFNQHRAKHVAQPEMMLLGGGYQLAPDAGFWSQVYHSVQCDWFAAGFLMNGCHYQLLGGHLSVKRELFAKFEFEEKIRFGGSETELLKRLQEAGIRSCGEPRLSIQHHSQLSFGKLLRKAYLQGKGHSAYQFSDFNPVPRQVRPEHFAQASFAIPIRLGRSLYRISFGLGRKPQLWSFWKLWQSEIFTSSKKTVYRLFLFFEFLSDPNMERKPKFSRHQFEETSGNKGEY